jgi:cell division protein FtsI (penicillin-binding protein 3)
VFKEIADQIYALKVSQGHNTVDASKKQIPVLTVIQGIQKDIKKVSQELSFNAKGDSKGNYSRMFKQGIDTVMTSQSISIKKMPALTGMGLKDAVYLSENLGLKVMIRGKKSDISIYCSRTKYIKRSNN